MTDDKLLLKLFDRAFQDNVVIDRKQFNQRLSRLGKDIITQAYWQMKAAGLIESKRMGGKLINKRDTI